ncbi:EF-P lysine aminoacylase GenX [Candidatus Gottesmanbacteria bacterium]|nr:EF-P lysine aminoacylase GenX [Candidatus Gottesmanbacteria bacterium]
MATWRDFRKDPKLFNNLKIRERIIASIRHYFKEQNFLEVETPLLVPTVIPESYLEVFKTDQLDRRRAKKQMFLTASPEASQKKLIVAGLRNCFEITRSFRNGETDSQTHTPEFTILEWYRVSATYKQSMRDCQYLLRKIASDLHAFDKRKFPNASLICYQGKDISFQLPWTHLSVMEATERYADIGLNDITEKRAQTFHQIFSVSKIAAVAQKKGYSVGKKDSWEQIFNQIFLNEVEPEVRKLEKPVILYDYPAPMAALSKLHPKDKRLAQRFELYIGGLELADSYSELTDWMEQEKRFQKELQTIHRLGKTPVIADSDFLDALKVGLPKSTGVALGVDRLVMLFCDEDSINRVRITV